MEQRKRWLAAIRRISAKLINLLFGETREIVVLKPEMDFGKSLTGIGIAGALFQFVRISRALIVCPSSIVEGAAGI